MDFETLQEISIPAISCLVFCILKIVKQLSNHNKTLLKFIPLIAGGLGVGFGILFFELASEVTLSKNLFTAIITGGAGGLAATGTHQVIAQLFKENCKNENEEKKDRP